MKKHRKQVVKVLGQKRFIDVPVDDELYKLDSREEYQRKRSRKKHVSLDAIVITEVTVGVAEAYEKAQLSECLEKALQALTAKERQLIEYIYYDGLTERETAVILKISQPAVTKRKHRIIKKLRNSLNDWIE
jgi:RNA polymerase sigma-B factor